MITLRLICEFACLFLVFWMTPIIAIRVMKKEPLAPLNFVLLAFGLAGFITLHYVSRANNASDQLQRYKQAESGNR